MFGKDGTTVRSEYHNHDHLFTAQPQQPTTSPNHQPPKPTPRAYKNVPRGRTNHNAVKPHTGLFLTASRFLMTCLLLTPALAKPIHEFIGPFQENELMRQLERDSGSDTGQGGWHWRRMRRVKNVFGGEMWKRQNGDGELSTTDEIGTTDAWSMTDNVATTTDDGIWTETGAPMLYSDTTAMTYDTYQTSFTETSYITEDSYPTSFPTMQALFNYETSSPIPSTSELETPHSIDATTDFTVTATQFSNLQYHAETAIYSDAMPSTFAFSSNTIDPTTQSSFQSETEQTIPFTTTVQLIPSTAYSNIATFTPTTDSSISLFVPSTAQFGSTNDVTSSQSERPQSFWYHEADTTSELGNTLDTLINSNVYAVETSTEPAVVFETWGYSDGEISSEMPLPTSTAAQTSETFMYYNAFLEFTTLTNALMDSTELPYSSETLVYSMMNSGIVTSTLVSPPPAGTTSELLSSVNFHEATSTEISFLTRSSVVNSNVATTTELPLGSTSSEQYSAELYSMTNDMATATELPFASTSEQDPRTLLYSTANAEIATTATPVYSSAPAISSEPWFYSVEYTRASSAGSASPYTTSDLIFFSITQDRTLQSNAVVWKEAPAALSNGDLVPSTIYSEFRASEVVTVTRTSDMILSFTTASSNEFHNDASQSSTGYMEPSSSLEWLTRQDITDRSVPTASATFGYSVAETDKSVAVETGTMVSFSTSGAAVYSASLSMILPVATSTLDQSAEPSRSLTSSISYPGYYTTNFPSSTVSSTFVYSAYYPTFVSSDPGRNEILSSAALQSTGLTASVSSSISEYSIPTYSVTEEYFYTSPSITTNPITNTKPAPVSSAFFASTSTDIPTSSLSSTVSQSLLPTYSTTVPSFTTSPPIFATSAGASTIPDPIMDPVSSQSLSIPETSTQAYPDMLEIYLNNYAYQRSSAMFQTTEFYTATLERYSSVTERSTSTVFYATTTSNLPFPDITYGPLFSFVDVTTDGFTSTVTMVSSAETSFTSRLGITASSTLPYPYSTIPPLQSATTASVISTWSLQRTVPSTTASYVNGTGSAAPILPTSNLRTSLTSTSAISKSPNTTSAEQTSTLPSVDITPSPLSNILSSTVDSSSSTISEPTEAAPASADQPYAAAPRSSRTTKPLPTPSIPCPIPGQIHTCGSCSFKDKRDCRGLCPSATAPPFITDCTDTCVSLPEAQTLDVCNVCGGTGDTCLDCLGVPFGTAQRDACGVCEGDGTTCGLVVKRLEPVVVPNSGNTFFDVVGAGLKPGAVEVRINGTVVRKEDLVHVDGYQRLRVFLKMVFGLVLDAGEEVGVSLSVDGSDAIEARLGVYQVGTNITAVSRNRVYVEEEQTVAFTGDIFFSEYNGMSSCIFRTLPKWTYANLRIIDSNRAECDVPVLTKSTAVEYILVYGITAESAEFVWRSDLGWPYMGNTSLNMFYYTYPPAVQSAMFSNDATSIHIAFDARVDTKPSSQVQDYRPCDDFFITDGSAASSPPLVRPGFPTDCKVRFQDRKKAILTFDPRVVSSFVASGLSGITLKENVLVLYQSDYSDFVTGSFNAAAPEVPPKPNVIIQGPDFVPPCGSIRMDLSRSSINGGEAFTNAAFNLMIIDGSIEVPDLSDALERETQRFLENQNRFSISTTSLPSTPYIFSCAMTNVFMGVGSSSKQVSVLNTTNFPSVTVLYPTAKIKSTEPIQLTAQTENSSGCGVPTKPTLTWSYLNGTNGFNYFINPKLSTKSTFTIPPRSLPPQSEFFFQLSIDSGDFYGVSVFSFVTAEEIITVNNGGNVTLPVSKAKLWGSFTDDSFSLFDSTLFSFQWFCFLNDEPCGFLDSKTLANEKDIDFSGMLPEGNYMFFLQVTNIMTTAAGMSKPVFVELVNRTFPVFNIRLLGSQSSFLSDGASLFSIVDPTSVQKYSKTAFEWNITSSCDSDSTFLIPEFSKSLTYSNPDFKIPAVLLVPGGSYCISLKVIDPILGVSATNFKSFTVGDVPKGGYCDVTSSSTGVEFFTTFSFRCIGWVSSSPPEVYRWEIRATGSKVWRVLSGPDMSPTLSSAFARGSYQIRATVLDSYGVKNLVEQIMSIVVTATSKDSRRGIWYRRRNLGNSVQRRQGNATVSSSIALSYLNDVVIPNFNSFGDANAALTSMSSLSMALYDETYPEMSKVDLRSGLLSFFETVVSSGLLYITDQLYGPVLLSTLLSIVNSTSAESSTAFTAGQIDDISSLTQTIVTELISNVRGTGRCIGQDLLGQTFTIISQIWDMLGSFDSSLYEAFWTIMDVIESCYFDSFLCGDVGQKFANRLFKFQFGLDRITTESKQLCEVDFNSTSLYSFQDERGCLRYVCGSWNQIPLLHNTSTSPYVSMNEVGNFVQLLNRNANQNSSIFATATIAFESGFSSNISALPLNELNSRMACGVAMVSNLTMEWNLEACTLVSSNDTAAICSCSETGVFVVGLTPASDSVTFYPSSTSTGKLTTDEDSGPAESKVGLICGAVFGTLAFAIWLAIFILGMYRARDRVFAKPEHTLQLPRNSEWNDGKPFYDDEGEISVLFLPPENQSTKIQSPDFPVLSPMTEPAPTSEPAPEHPAPVVAPIAVPIQKPAQLTTRPATFQLSPFRQPATSQEPSPSKPQPDLKRVYPEGLPVQPPASRQQDLKRVYPSPVTVPTFSKPNPPPIFSVPAETLLDSRRPIAAASVLQGPSTLMKPKEELFIQPIMQPEVPLRAYPLDDPADPSATPAAQSGKSPIWMQNQNNLIFSPQNVIAQTPTVASPNEFVLRKPNAPQPNQPQAFIGEANVSHLLSDPRNARKPPAQDENNGQWPLE
ncbi:hypothetical protein HDU97_005824 [Phlyctochytrium planicorne]|nr:hypothetical protein HDU97_005824 [Phlyctochytrium planicorne]